MVVADVEQTRHQIRSAIESTDIKVIELESGRLVRDAAANQYDLDLVIVDSQIGSMGGFAVIQDLHLEEYDNRIPQIPSLILLDRRADAWMARQVAAEGFLVKPLNPVKISKAVKAILNGHTYYDESYAPISAMTSFESAVSLPGLAGNPL